MMPILLMEMDVVPLASLRVDILVLKRLINTLNRPVLSHVLVLVALLPLFVEMDSEIQMNNAMMEIMYNLMGVQIAQ